MNYKFIMCGILVIYGKNNTHLFRKKVLKLSKLLRHRGPDWNGIYYNNNAIICHERLTVVGLNSAAAQLAIGHGGSSNWDSAMDRVEVGHSMAIFCETADGADRNAYIGNNLYYNSLLTNYHIQLKKNSLKN